MVSPVSESMGYEKMFNGRTLGWRVGTSSWNVQIVWSSTSQHKFQKVTITDGINKAPLLSQSLDFYFNNEICNPIFKYYKLIILVADTK